MKTAQVRWFCLLLLWLASLSAQAQKYLVDVSLSPPPTAYRALLVDVQRALNEVTATIHNRTSQHISVKFQVSLTHMTSDFSIRSNQDVLPISMTPNETLTKTGQELVDDLSATQFTVSQNGQEKSLLDFYAGNPETVIPDGKYQLCIIPLADNQNQQLIDIRTCQSITIDFNAWVSPQLQAINNLPCPDTLQPFDPTLPQWQLPIAWSWNIPIGQRIDGNYKFTVYVVELLPNDTRDANQVLQALTDNPEGSDVIVRKTFTGPGSGFYFIENLLPPDFSPRQGITSGLQLGYRYGVSVRAENQAGQQVDLPNNGFSPVCVFIYGKALPAGAGPGPLADADFDTVIPDCACSTTSTVATAGDAYADPIPADTRIKMGYFRIKVKETVTASGGSYSGEGTIKVSKDGLMGRVRVRFSNLTIRRINGLLTAVGGTAEAMEEAGLVPGQVRSSLGGLGNVKFNAGDIPIIGDVFAGLQSGGRFLNQLISDDDISLPFGISTPVGEQMLQAGVFGMTFTPNNAQINIILQTPSLGDLQPLYFGAKQVCLSPKGLSVDGTTFYLGGDLTTEYPTYNLTLKGAESGVSSGTASNRATSITLGCNWAFQRINLVGEVALKNDFIRPAGYRPAGSATSPETPHYVKATFGASFSSFQDVLLSADVTPFYFAADSAWKFTVANVYLDLSPSRNPDGMTLTAAERPGTTPAEINTWTGLYAGEVSVGFPVVLQATSRNQLRAGFQGLKIGFNSGISFTAFAANLLELTGGNAGTLGGWQFAIDTLRMSVENNQFQPPAMAGRLRFPLFDEPFYYGAQFAASSATDPTRVFQISVRVDERASIYARSFKSRFALTSGSRIECTFAPQSQSPTTSRARLVALLNGNWTIEDQEKDVSFQAMSFTGFKYDSDRGFDNSSFVASYTSAAPGSGSAASGRDLCGHTSNGFNIEISEIAPLFEGKFDATGGARCGIRLGVDVMLVGGCKGSSTSDDSWGFGAGATFELSGRVALTGGIPQVRDVEFGLKAIRIDVDVSVCHVAGSLELIDDDPTYGNGFRGCVAFELGVGLKVKGSVGAIFGKTKGSNPYNYFAVDGYIGGLNVMLGQYITISGFTGGLSMHMALRTDNPNVPPIDAVVNRLTNVGRCDAETPLNQFPLVPTSEDITQVMFGVLFKDVVGGGMAFNGGMGLGAQINANGGLDFLAVGGFMDFVKPPTETIAVVANNGMMLRGKLGLMYNFVEKKLTGTASVFLNVGNVLYGSAEGGEQYQAGKMALYIADDDWYIFIGNPWKPDNIGDPGGLLPSIPRYTEVSLELPVIGRLGGAGVYFAMGTYGINGLPPLPPESKIHIPDDMRDDLNATRGGASPALANGGVAFGGWLYFGFHTDWFLGFRAGVDMGAGFDAALLRYTSAASCAGGSGTFGINDFYGRGQAYAYVDGHLQYNDDGRAKNIYSLNAQFIADFGGPNPTWIKGKLKFQNTTLQKAVYNFFPPMGLIIDFVLDDEDDEGQPAYTTIPFEAGTPCLPSANTIDENRSVGTEPIISQIMPGDSVEAGQPISVRLNRSTGTWFDWYNPRTNRTIKRRWALSNYLLKRRNGTTIPLGITERPNEDEYIFTPQPTDSSQQPTTGERIEFKIRYVVQEKTGSGPNDWSDTEFFDERTVRLRVKATDFRLTSADVLFSYPAAGQQFFLTNEGPNEDRFVLLNQPHSELNGLYSNLLASAYTRKMVVRIKDGETQLGEVPFTVQMLPNNRSALVFRLPNLPNSRALRLEFWKIATPLPTTRTSVNTQGMSLNGQGVGSASPSAPHELSTRLYDYSFSTSKYGTFAEKIAATRLGTFRSTGGDWGMTATLTTDEGWDALDLGPDNPLDNGRDQVRSAIQAEVLTNTTWHQQVLSLFQEKRGQLSPGNADARARSVALSTWIQVFTAGQLRGSISRDDDRIQLGFPTNGSLRDMAEAVDVLLTDPPAETYNVRLTYAYPSLQAYSPYNGDPRKIYNKRDGLTALPLAISYEGYEAGQLRMARATTAMLEAAGRAIRGEQVRPTR